MKRILFIGMPGAGKGTQAQLLAKEGYTHVSTGEAIREGFKRKEPHLLPFQKAIDEGGLLPDKIILELIEDVVKHTKGKGIILDGAVRTLPQAKYVVSHKLIDKAIFFTLTQEVALQRLARRAQEAKVRRADDNAQAFKKRFQEYKKKTQPMITFLKKALGKDFIEIDASSKPETIFKEVKNRLQ